MILKLPIIPLFVKTSILKTFVALVLTFTGYCSLAQVNYSARDDYNLEELKEENKNMIMVPENDGLELAINLALRHYPELTGHRIKLIYREKARYPITAGYPGRNVLKRRRKHRYTLILSPNSFVKNLTLNKQVAVIGHEMAHFVYYTERPAIAMAWWGFRYLINKKFRYQFEREADYSAIDHGLGTQMLGLSMYISRSQVEEYLSKKGLPSTGN